MPEAEATAEDCVAVIAMDDEVAIAPATRSKLLATEDLTNMMLTLTDWMTVARSGMREDTGE